MNAKIQDLGSLLRAKRKELDKKCTLMLGAGASFSSGVIPTDRIMEELLALHGRGLTNGTLRERFDLLWARSDPDTRDMFLKKYLELKPSLGYSHLAKLIAEDYFDLIITFNFDQLLETALNELRFTDYVTVVRGEFHSDDAVRKAMEMTRPRVKILKMHGGLKGGDNFLFTSAEMDDYRDEIRTLFQELTRGDILVCGYAFQDRCVEMAFSRYGGQVYWVNPGGAPPGVAAILRKRKSTEWVFDRQAGGYFDTFFADLHETLTQPEKKVEKSRSNPFKFLLSYDERDTAWFHGRTWLTQRVLSEFKNEPPKVLHLLGPMKSGKTSFVRAGLVAKLDRDRFRPVYLRCQGELESWLPKSIGKILAGAGQCDAKGAIKMLAESTDKHVVVVLDQFERAVDWYPGKRQLVHCLNGLCECACKNLTFVCVGVEDLRYLKALGEAKLGYIEIPPLRAKVVGGIIGRMARKAGIRFEPEVIQAIMKRYGEPGEPEHPFTLAHVQAVCNILADSTFVDLASYERALENNREALNVALNVCDVVSFVEDMPDETGRNLFRKVMKVIPVESKKILAMHLKAHFWDLISPPEYEERLESSGEGRHGAG